MRTKYGRRWSSWYSRCPFDVLWASWISVLSVWNISGLSRRWNIVTVRVLPVVSVPAPTKVRASSARRHAALSCADRVGESNIWCIALGLSATFAVVACESTMELVVPTISYYHSKQASFLLLLKGWVFPTYIEEVMDGDTSRINHRHEPPWHRGKNI